MSSKLLIAEEVAEILRVSAQRVYELVRTDQIPFVRLGERQYRFSKSEIEAWLANGGSMEKVAGEQDNVFKL